MYKEALLLEIDRISDVEDDTLAKRIAGFLSANDPRNSSKYIRAYISRKIK